MVPRVSIGLPVYNGAKYICAAIESVLNQTFTDFELLIADNASTDDTEAICREYAAKDSRIRYYRNPENLGAAPNFNLAFEQSVAPYFRWHAHDDLIAPTYLEKCVPVLDNHPDVVLVHTRTRLIDENGQTIHFPTRPDGSAAGEMITPDGRKYVYGLDPATRKLDSPRADERFRSVILRTHWSYEIFGLVRREALARGGLQESFYGTDKVILAELSTQGRIIILDDDLFWNRRHPEQSASIADPQKRDMWNNVSKNKSKNHTSPRPKRLRGYMRAISLGHMSAQERANCYRAVFTKIVVNVKPSVAFYL